MTSEHFNVHYLESYQLQTKRAVFIAEDLYKKLQKKFVWTPKERISMVVTDEYDQANGSATPIPFNKVVLRLSPPDKVTQLDDYDDWLALLIEHELTHIFHIDKSVGKVSKLRLALGRYLLLFPNLLQPAWFIEGLATYNETHQGIGRGQSSSYEMLMREEVNKGLLAVDNVNLPPDSQPLGKHYLYGAYFYQFLKEKYGEESIKRLIYNYSNNLLPFAINSNSKRVYGKDITELWEEFTAYLNVRFSKQLSVLKKSAIKPVNIVVSKPHNLSEFEIASDQSIIYIDDNLESPAQLLRLKNGNTKLLTEVNSNSKFSLGSNDYIYITQQDFCDEYHIYYDLYRYSVKNDNLTKLTECSRYKLLSVSISNSIYAVKTVASIPQIDLLDKDGKLSKTIWQGGYGDVINSIDLSGSEDKLLISMKSLQQSWRIVELDFKTKKLLEVQSGEPSFMQARYVTGDDSIVYISDVSGVYNVYKKSLASEKYTALTDVVSGAFSPVQAGNKLFYQSFERDGYSIVSTNLNETHPKVIRKHLKPIPRYPLMADDQFPNYKVSNYSPWSDLKPRYWFPWLSVQNEASEIGFVTSSQDSLDSHYYQLNLAYGYDQEELIGLFLYQYENWFSLLISKENTIYSNDLTELTDVIRTNQQWQLRFTLPFTKVADRWRFNLGLIENSDFDSFRANGVTGFLDQEDGLLGFSAYYDSKRSFLKGNSPETGRDVLLVTESSDVFDSDFVGQATTLDWREFFRLGSHNTLALRYVAGRSDPTMRQYRLGGLKSDFDNITIFNTQASRAVFNKRTFSLRGYAENSQSGNNIELATVEWRFPLFQVERGFMAPPVGIVKHSGRLFTESGSSWDDNQTKDIVSSVGFEWLIDFNIFYRLTTQLRLGYAEGLDDTGDEVYYLKFGTAF